MIKAYFERYDLELDLELSVKRMAYSESKMNV